MERQGTTRQRAPLAAAEKVERKQPATTEDDLRNRAYEIYLKRGPNAGDEIGDWLQAEREIKAN
ncbi:MAG: DUF2934 domain-containing protein [Terriglobia bacterium]